MRLRWTERFASFLGHRVWEPKAAEPREEATLRYLFHCQGQLIVGITGVVQGGEIPIHHIYNWTKRFGAPMSALLQREAVPSLIR